MVTVSIFLAAPNGKTKKLQLYSVHQRLSKELSIPIKGKKNVLFISKVSG